ncbi:glycosyltransferase family 4 protein [Fulvivirga sp. M361]|uniref:glycosyltransferase family 4 protein n=1 Tax=Fulvivirga sp. M361 TaxID=2594266 RepID=UPI00117B958D|nr:glycosyltransferase family 4 protein [Fulvivirga sp. M361]TRX50229.1 glycosyltransferase family 4 protein [Fulvivirga sp. M361]
MEKRLAIVHFSPLEYFPPTINLLKFFSTKPSIHVEIFTCENPGKRKKTTIDNTKIRRHKFPSTDSPGPVRLFRYIIFNMATLMGLIRSNPDYILYYESYSVWPVYVYLKYFNKSSKLYIHYHEYSSPEWYQNGMRLVRLYHNMEERYLYGRSEWISQTNAYRKSFFLRDNPTLDKSKLRVLSNYPPGNWYFDTKESTLDKEQVKFVYVGSLSIAGTFLKEFCEWVINQCGQVTFDIYSFNLTGPAREYLSGINSKFITFHSNGLEYGDLPKTLKKYDVGIIFYKASNENVIYCISNKFYEYYACGLDIWFSKEMEATWPMEKLKTNQDIVRMDFESLKKGYTASKNKKVAITGDKDIFRYEDEYQKLLDHFLSVHAF